ncbi:MAG: ATP-binding protein [Pseudomonadota bacterium]|nr:ATP-binding protein [Gammaproteobacteria bacterium]MBU1558541.1 ATP-binding protein [Gammaproteobacteria bacterium]MBU1629032.1 ATP-binding protein [Gammaproteobacteria bacterium]MBU1927044.1 ATP-binding protein [Gammaproteobacteria bacterium]MBU2546678.1 ATP-binding protein [Gammaproteobacteria bacterium]
MEYQKRYITDQVATDLNQKMVFIGGPRQVGKTTLAQHFLPNTQLGYLNWDIPMHREAILKRELPDTPIWVFDEIHKYKKWRDFLKGLYDQYHHQRKILVTGSARLDYYRYGGDSLQGRYYFLRLNPLSVGELHLQSMEEVQTLLTLGGFPEPYFSGKEIDAKRWSREYRQRLIQEDLVSLEHVKDIQSLELLMLRLPELVGSPLSINSLRKDLQVSHATLSNWLDIFTRLYAIFRLSPFGSSRLRAVKKEQKHYHYDWTLIDNPGTRFENMVAMHLLKWVQFEQDTKARNLDLCYFRDIDGREIDFVITENKQPLTAIECKWSDTEISKSLHYFKKRFPQCAAWQISMTGTKNYLSAQDIRVAPALELLQQLI